MVRDPHGDQDRHGVFVLQPLRGRRRVGGPAGGAGLRSVRPDRDRRTLRPATDGQGGAGPHRPAHPSPGHRRAAPRRPRSRGSTTCTWSGPASTRPSWDARISYAGLGPAATTNETDDDNDEEDSEHRHTAIALGLYPHALRQGPGPVHAAPTRRTCRGGGPHRLVRGRERPSACHRRGRRRKDRLGARRPADLDDSRHTIIYLGNPAIGARGLYATIVSRLGGVPRFHKAALIPQATDALAAEVAERGKGWSSSSTRPISWPPISSKSCGC